MDYPHLIQIETSGACNAACSFCPHSTMTNAAQTRMTQSTFSRIVDELATWPVPPAEICPFLTNEPFADSRIYDFCREINAKLPTTTLAFFTNGSLFTPHTLTRLEPVTGINFIHISLHHSTAAAYEADLHIPFARTLASVHRLIDTGRYNVRLGRVQNGDAALDSDFLDFCQVEFPGIPAMLSYRYNWKGDIASHFDTASTLDIICPRTSSMTVLADGRVALCCMDEHGAYELGDTAKDSLATIYNSPRALAHRTTFKRHLTPCSNCNMHA